MSTITATMASFGVSTIYCCQDVVQGNQIYGRDGFKAIINNLSTQFFGKANDPDSAKFYESYFPLIKRKEKSRTTGESRNSTTTSTKEVPKHRAQEFFELKQGQFGFISSGKADLFQFKMPVIEKKEIPVLKEVTAQQKIDNFNKIINDMQNFISY